MICISVTPHSRVLAKVDLFNASHQGDIIELCIDHLVKEPDFKDLLSDVSKPVIISCRRKQDGGQWDGSEEDRLMLLRQAIVAGPDYIELDLDIAPKIPRFGKTQRVISFTRLDRPEYDIDSVFEEAAAQHADIIKFRWPTPTLEDVWPLLAAVSQRRAIPIVGQGLGRPELTFSLLGKKYDSPWIYAALEKGMEDHPGQCTVNELREIYRISDIDRKTKFVAVAGMGPSETATLQALNAGFQDLGLNIRCLPVVINNLERLAKMFDILKIHVLIANSSLGTRIQPFVEHCEDTDRRTRYLDTLLKQTDGWHGYNSLWRSLAKNLELALQHAFGQETHLNQRSALVIGTGGTSLTAIQALRQKQAVVSITGPDDKVAREMAETLQLRHVPFQSLYDVHNDIVVLADPEVQPGSGRLQMNPSYFQPHMLVLDLSHLPEEHPLTEEARLRGSRVFDSRQIWHAQIAAQFRAITGENYPL